MLDETLAFRIKEMIAGALEYADGSALGEVFAFGFMEDGVRFFQAFFRKDSQVFTWADLPGMDVSAERQGLLSKFGLNQIIEISNVALTENSPVPTVIKARYDVRADRLTSEISYEPQLDPDDLDRSWHDVAHEWFEQLRDEARSGSAGG